jgi:hypothetical protein
VQQRSVRALPPAGRHRSARTAVRHPEGTHRRRHGGFLVYADVPRFSWPWDALGRQCRRATPQLARWEVCDATAVGRGGGPRAARDAVSLTDDMYSTCRAAQHSVLKAGEKAPKQCNFLAWKAGKPVTLNAARPHVDDMI